MTATQIIQEIEAAGGVLSLMGDRITYDVPKAVRPLVESLRERKDEVIEILKARGGRVANFPHCPKCASYDLYRENNIGNYECQTCGLTEIEESTARRVV